MADSPYYRRRVWDPAVRILHWWMAVTLLVQFALAGVILSEDALGLSEAGEHGLVTVHAVFGFAFGAGLVLRIVWLFRAPGSGSWRDLIPVTGAQWRTVAATARHYVSGFRGEAPFYRAHNPLAGIVYALFFVVAVIQIATGAGLFTIGEDTLGETWEAIHETGFWLIAIYVVIHLIMVAIHELTERRALISAMVNGRKLFTAEELERHPEAQKEEGD